MILAGSVDKKITVNGTVTKTSVEVVRAEISKRVNTAEPPLPATPSFFPNSAVKVQGNEISEGGKTYYTGNSVENGLSVSNTTLTFQIPSTGLLSIAVTKLDLGNSTTINIQGTGVVMIYVRDTVYANQLKINMNKDTRLLIYSNTGEINDGKEDIYFKNGLTVPEGGLYIYTPEKDLNIENAPNLATPKINGAIVARNTNLKNSLNFVVPMPLPVEFDPTASNTSYYGLYVRYGGWSQ